MNTFPEVGRAEYLTCAQTAKLIRATLAKRFPGYQFSVRSSTYAGGASIDVGWYDGPPAKVVDGVIGGFAGKGFDGMIDLAYYKKAWLLPDGSAVLAESPGTEASRGSVPEVIVDPPSPDARLIRFGADYVHTQRTLTPQAEAIIDRKVRAKYGDNITAPPTSGGCDDWYRRVCRAEIENRWLFPPCRFTYSVTRWENNEYVTEAEGFTSKSAAGKKAAELQKARNPRGWRYVKVERGGAL